MSYIKCIMGRDMRKKNYMTQSTSQNKELPKTTFLLSPIKGSPRDNWGPCVSLIPWPADSTECTLTFSIVLL